MSDEERASQPATKGDIDHLQGQITEIRERGNIRHEDHENRIQAQEFFRMWLNVAILAALIIVIILQIFISSRL